MVYRITTDMLLCVFTFILIFHIYMESVLSKTSDDDSASSLTVEAVAGSLAKLPCDVTPPTEGDKVHLIIWYKGVSDLPIYSFDSRDISTDDATHWSDESTLGKRAYFMFKEDPATLTVENIKESDKGLYRCRVDFRKSPTRNYKVNLTIILPPDKLSVLDERGSHIQHYILGPYNLGSSVDITCIAAGGRPLPNVTWWQENSLLDDTFEILSARRVRNILHLERVERYHLNTVFTCQASNNDVLPPISSAVTLDLNLSPLWVKLQGDQRPFSADQRYELTCEVVGARPVPIITWLKGEYLLHNARSSASNDGNTTISTLSFVPTVEDSGQKLTCRSTSSHALDTYFEDSWTLNVYHVPLVNLELQKSLRGINLNEGMDITLECFIRSNPRVYRISWKHNGKVLYHNASAGTVITNQSLILVNATRARTGTYICVGSNQEGDGESDPLYLDIKFIPVCRPGQQKIIGVARQDTARITCEVEANPMEVKFSWRFNSSLGGFDILPSNFTTEGARSIAAFTPITEHDYGNLLCWAKNELGLQQMPCVYNLTPVAGKPDQVFNCTIHNQTADTLHVECEEGYNGGLDTEYVMEVYDLETNALVSNATFRFPLFIVTGLPSEEGFGIEIYAFNTKGRSPRTVLHAYTLQSAARRSALSPVILQLTPLLGILAGITLSLFFVTMGILLGLRFRKHDNVDKKRNKNKESSESVDSLEKNPDIIPQNSDLMNSEEIDLDKVNKHYYSTHMCEEVKCNTLDNNLKYADLQIQIESYACTTPPQILRPSQCTVYAQIDSSSSCLMPETTLSFNSRENQISTLERRNPSQLHRMSTTHF